MSTLECRTSSIPVEKCWLELLAITQRCGTLQSDAALTVDDVFRKTCKRIMAELEPTYGVTVPCDTFQN